jgi:MbtH protein
MSNLNVETPAQEKRLFKVVCNHEEQFSIWPASRVIPVGWNEEGCVGSEEAYLQHIDRVWVNMIPLSLRPENSGIATADPVELRLGDAQCSAARD